MTNKIRELFLLKQDLVFLNHGSFGACPKPVFEAYQAWQLKLERQPVAFLDQSRDIISNLKPVRIAVANELGASSEDLVGVTNATEGLNIVAHSLKLQPGDEILTINHEYGALEKTWELVTERSGAKVLEVEIPLPLVSKEQFVDALINAMTEKTKILFLSHISSPTALLFPIEDVVAEARKRGIISIIDGAHAPGLIDLNLDALGADFYCGNCHKWMMAPKGSAFLWARKQVQPLLEPLVVSHGWTAQSGGPEQQGIFGNSRFLDCFEIRGTRDPSAWLATQDAIKFAKLHNWSEKVKHADALARETAQTISNLTQLPLFSSPEFCAPQMIAIPLPECDVDNLKRRLYEEFNIEIPVFRWRGHCIVRISVQVYNTREEANCLVDALTKILNLGVKES